MTPEQHRAQADTIARILIDPDRIFRRGERQLGLILAGMHLAAASGDYVGEARNRGSFSAEPSEPAA